MIPVENLSILSRDEAHLNGTKIRPLYSPSYYVGLQNHIANFKAVIVRVHFIVVIWFENITFLGIASVVVIYSQKEVSPRKYIYCALWIRNFSWNWHDKSIDKMWDSERKNKMAKTELWVVRSRFETIVRTIIIL